MISAHIARQCLLPLVAAVWLVLSCAPMQAEIKPDLSDRYLQREFDWAMYVDVQELKHHMDYRGSRLNPVTRARVTYRAFARNVINVTPTEAVVYEDFWYHDGRVLGVRRRNQINIPREHIGAIIVSPKPDGSLDKAENVQAIANVILRLIVDMQMRDAVISVVMVPTDRYDEVAQGLGNYRFQPDSGAAQGRQLSIHLRAHPQGPDEYLFYQKGM